LLGLTHGRGRGGRPPRVRVSPLFASTTVCCAGRPATRYRAARETLPRVPTAFQGSKCVLGELKRRKYQVKARYQIRANALLLPLPLVYGMYCNKGWSGGNTVLRTSVGDGGGVRGAQTKGVFAKHSIDSSAKASS